MKQNNHVNLFTYFNCRLNYNNLHVEYFDTVVPLSQYSIIFNLFFYFSSTLFLFNNIFSWRERRLTKMHVPKYKYRSIYSLNLRVDCIRIIEIRMINILLCLQSMETDIDNTSFVFTEISSKRKKKKKSANIFLLYKRSHSGRDDETKDQDHFPSAPVTVELRVPFNLKVA